MTPDGLFLDVSSACDWQHPTIRHLAQRLTQECATETAQAVRLFHWVRDEIAFQVGDWQYTASATLAARRGTCSNKANLLVALARATGIPAGFYVMRVDGKRYLGPIVPATLRKFIAARSIHVYATLQVGGRWLRCDPSDDRRFAENTAHLNPQSRLVEWDGQQDAVVQLHPAHVFADHGPLVSIDHLLTTPRRVPAVIVRMGNLYIHFLREHGAQFHTHAALDRAFRTWLRTRAPGLYLLYHLAALWRER
jgi:hypothetical protein